MLEKTEGIVLHTTKHSDSGIIAHILTRKFGRLDFMVRGTHNRRGSTRNVFFQPLQVLELNIYYKDGRNLNSIKEVSLAKPFKSIPLDQYKSAIAIFISEIMYRSLHETESAESLYDYLRYSIDVLDDSEKRNSNFHIGFMIGLARFLGIAPTIIDKPHMFFDIQNGVFCQSPPLHGFYLQKEQSALLKKFLASTIVDCEEIPLSGKDRKEFLESLVTYFSFHLPGIKNIKSLDILSQLFI